MPPSTTISVPVVKRASSEARNSAACAVSRPSPMNPSGMRARRCLRRASTSPPVRCLASRASTIGVCNWPGITVFTRMLCLAYCTATTRENWITPALVAAYATCGEPLKRIPEAEEILTMAPPFCRTMTGRTYLQARNTVLRLESSWRCQASSGNSTGPPAAEPPTLLTRTSIRSWAFTQASTMAETALLSVALHRWDVISPPASRTRSMVSRIESASRSTAKTLAPSRAKITAMARPLPQPGPTQPAPTTIATLPSSLPAMVLIDLDAGGLHHLRPFLDFTPHIGGKFLRRAADQNGSLAEELFLYLRRLDGGNRGGIQFRNDRKGRPGRGHHAIPIVGLDLRVANFAHRRQVRQRLHPQPAPNRKRLDGASRDLWQQNRYVEEHDVNLMADEIIHSRRGAPIGHMDDVDLGAGAEQLAGEMRHAARAGRPVVDGARLRFGKGDQFLHIGDRYSGGGDQELRYPGDEGDRGEILERIIENLLLQGGADRQRAGAGDRDRITIRLGLRHVIGAERARGAGAVVDDDQLPEQLLHLLAEHPADDVVRSARRKGYNESNRLVGIILGVCRQRRGAQGDET